MTRSASLNTAGAYLPMAACLRRPATSAGELSPRKRRFRIVSYGRSHTLVTPSGSSPTPGAVFLSDAREDADAARRIADALRGFGVDVWFNQKELRYSDEGRIFAIGLCPLAQGFEAFRDGKNALKYP